MDPKIIGLLAVASLLVGYGILSIGMDQIKSESETSGRLSDLLRPSVLPRKALYEKPRDFELGGKRTKRHRESKKYSKKV